MTGPIRRALVAVLTVLEASGILLAALRAGAAPVAAAGVVGTGTAASCTEAALDAALSGGGSVTFNCGPAPALITLTSQKVISANTTITGANLITLSGGNATRLFYVNGGVTLTLNTLSLTNGFASRNDGGAIYNLGTLVLNGTTIQNSSASLSGGAIVTYGPLTLNGSTLASNSAINGGALYARFAPAQVTITNGVLHDNHATGTDPNSGGWGGAILLWDGATVSLTTSRALC